jgi:hypothetical protein
MQPAAAMDRNWWSEGRLAIPWVEVACRGCKRGRPTDESLGGIEAPMHPFSRSGQLFFEVNARARPSLRPTKWMSGASPILMAARFCARQPARRRSATVHRTSAADCAPGRRRACALRRLRSFPAHGCTRCSRIAITGPSRSSLPVRP